MKNVVVIGATGHFGGRICRRLLTEDGIRLYVTSRSLASARSLADELRARSAGSAIEPVKLDQDSASFASDLGALQPHIVIHTAGPYQGQDYSVAQTCLEHGSHYIDLADGRAFVNGFHSLNDRALSKDLLLVTGASTLPGLSSVVISTYQQQFADITGIESTIAPAHQTPRGKSTIAAVMSYCGKPFSVLERGKWNVRYGWQDLRVVKYPGLRTRFAAACDVPDLELFPNIYRRARTVTFHAALEAPWEQMALWLRAGLSRIGFINDWSRFTSLFDFFSRRLITFGSDRGGMSIRISGINKNNQPLVINWNLSAGSNHGPEIPCTPALLVVRKLLRDQLPIRGAMPCLSLFTLEEFAKELEQFDISWSHQSA